MAVEQHNASQQASQTLALTKAAAQLYRMHGAYGSGRGESGKRPA